MFSNGKSIASVFIYTLLLFPSGVLHKVGVGFPVAFGYGIPYLIALEIVFDSLCVFGVVVEDVGFHIALVAGFEVLHHALQTSPPDKVHSSPAFCTEFTRTFVFQFVHEIVLMIGRCQVLGSGSVVACRA